MGDKVFYKKLIRLTLPLSLQSLMLAAVAAADAIMLGSIEQNAMSAVSLATQIQFVQNMILGAVTGTAGILGAQYWGKGDHETLKDLFWIILRLCGGTSLVFFLGCVLCPEVLMRIFTNEEVLVTIGSDYLRLAGWSYLLTGVSQCYLTMMKVSEHAARSAWISSVTVVINIVLNAVCIFGLGPIPAMGVRGAAAATLIARVIEIVWALASSFQKNYLRPGIEGFRPRKAGLRKDFARCGLPLLGASLLWGVGFTSYTAIMGHMGTDAAAANSATAVVRDLMCCFCNGFAAGGGIVVGNELGAGRLEQGRIYGNRLMKIAFICGFMCTGIILLITPLLLRFIVLTDQAQAYLKGMMVIMPSILGSIR